MKKDEFVNELKKKNIEITDEQIELFEKYANFLLEYNKNVNLTAIRDMEGVYLKHFYDSILIVEGVNVDISKKESLIDVGTGAGFPGLVLKIMYPHIKLTLIDSNNKKTTFLEKLVNYLKLDDVTVVNDRAEKFVKKHRQEFDITTARAVSDLSVIAELCLPLTKVGGFFIALKSKYEEELKKAMPAIEKLNSKLFLIKEEELPVEKSKRSILYFKVEDVIDKKYPRAYDQIIKKSLK